VQTARKIVLITGATRGLGRHLTEAFFEKGYAVVVNYLNARATAAELLSGREEHGLAIQADVGDPAEVSSMIRQTKDRFGGLDVVINNAGITRDNLLLRQSEREWDATLRTNLGGCFHVIREAAPLMQSSGGGHIINICSYSGVKGRVGQTAYSASKAALLGLTVSAARELAEYKIRVNAVIPGYMMTQMGAGAANAMKRAEEESLLHTLADPAHIARGISVIAAMDYITGQVISLDSRIL
jgi:3-oxoacyl-[acyl-carrier protein] reductase